MTMVYTRAATYAAVSIDDPMVASRLTRSEGLRTARCRHASYCEGGAYGGTRTTFGDVKRLRCPRHCLSLTTPDDMVRAGAGLVY